MEMDLVKYLIQRHDDYKILTGFKISEIDEYGKVFKIYLTFEGRYLILYMKQFDYMNCEYFIDRMYMNVKHIIDKDNKEGDNN